MEVISADVQLDPTRTGRRLQPRHRPAAEHQGPARRSRGRSPASRRRRSSARSGSSRTTGNLSIESPGKPASATGTIRLEPDGAGTTEVVELEIKVKVPLIGGKLEKLMAEKVGRGHGRRAHGRRRPG